MIEIIRSFPKQIREAFEFPVYNLDIKTIDRIIICGMGGSAIAGDLIKSYLYNIPIPIEVIRDYTVPKYISSKTIAFIVSYSGNTEETISAFNEVFKIGSRIIIITSGGKLKEIAENYKIPIVPIPKGIAPRCALGYIFTSILLNIEKNGIIQVSKELKDSIELIEKFIREFESGSSIAFDIANRFYLRFPIIYASNRLLPIAYRWQTQINENSKSICHINVIPEMNHNEINGIQNPQNIVLKSWIVFLKDLEDHQMIKTRIEITSEMLRDSVMGVSIIEGKGDIFLHRMLYLVLLGDYVSYYLSTLYNVNPFAIPRIEELKSKLKSKLEII